MPTHCLCCTDTGQPQVEMHVQAGAVSGEWSLRVASHYLAGLPLMRDKELSASQATVMACSDGFEISYSFARGKVIAR